MSVTAEVAQLHDVHEPRLRLRERVERRVHFEDLVFAAELYATF